MVMVRPRGGDFLYSDSELRVCGYEVHIRGGLHRGMEAWVVRSSFGARKGEGERDEDRGPQGGPGIGVRSGCAPPASA